MCKINFKKVEAPRALPQEFKVQEQIGQFPSNFEETDFTQNFLKTPDKTFNVNPFQFTFEPESEITFVKNAFPLDLDISLGSYAIPKSIDEDIINLNQVEELPSAINSIPMIEQHIYDIHEDEDEDEDEEDELERSLSPISSSNSNSAQYSPVSYDSSPPHTSFIPPNNLQFVPSNALPTPPQKRAAPECSIANNKKKAMTKAEPPCFEVDSKPNVPPPKRKTQVRNAKISDEKRERNRLAAEKYRKKGRDTIVTLERACHQLTAENAQLKDKSQMLEQQVQQLKTLLLQYGVSKELLDAVGLSV